MCDCGLFIIPFAQVSIGACLGGFRRSLQSGPKQTSLTPKPKSLLKGGSPSIV